ncbi:MAG: Uma2 family endonuclease [Cyanobacteriota bacterium]|nr:Uma2 family endonuclease [Cyanobacteriota bacterium]
MNTFTLDMTSVPLTDEQFFQLCQDNRDLKFERSAKGDLIIMPPTGGETGNRNGEITYQVQAWSRQNNLGIAFDSSTGFRLPNGADRSPDAAWVRRERWDALTSEQQTRFVPLCPDFVIELRSKSDTLAQLRRKMAEYRDNGTHLGLAIDRVSRTVEIYRPAQEVEVLNNPTTVGGEDVLPGFVLTMAPIW